MFRLGIIQSSKPSGPDVTPDPIVGSSIIYMDPNIYKVARFQITGISQPIVLEFGRTGGVHIFYYKIDTSEPPWVNGDVIYDILGWDTMNTNPGTITVNNNEYVSLACELLLGPSNGDVEIVNVTDNNTLLQTFAWATD